MTDIHEIPISHENNENNENTNIGADHISEDTPKIIKRGRPKGSPNKQKIKQIK